MKLVLLPGMDGTGKLFTEFLSHFDDEYLIIPLLQYGPQDHLTLAEAIESQLPSDDYILLAESFSGGIVPELLKSDPKYLKGVIFVASFLSNPNKYLLPIAKLLPIKALASAPFSKFAHKLLFLGQGSTDTQVSKFVKVIKSIPSSVLKNRLEVMSQQVLGTVSFDIPAIYIRAINDRLISDKKAQEFTKIFTNIKYLEIDAPHFILQTRPKESALLVSEGMSWCFQGSELS